LRTGFFIPLNIRKEIFKKGLIMNTTEHSHVIQSLRTAQLAEANYEKIVGLIKDLYLWFAPGSTDADINKRLHQHPDAMIDLLINKTTGMCDGFSVHYTELFQGNAVMFRGGTIVRQRSKGHYKELLEHSILGGRQDFVVAMTQNPRVYESLRAFSSTGIIYPSPDTESPLLVKKIAERFCKVPISDFDKMIVHNVYASIRKDEEFKTARDPAVAKMFKETLGVDDGFFIVVPT
jgi:hypothetical protein